MSDFVRANNKRTRIVLGILVLALAISSGGWILSARNGNGIRLECYSIAADKSLSVAPVHGSNTRRATFSIEETPDRVVLGYWEEHAGGMYTAEGHFSEFTYTLTQALGERPVVDPSGSAIPRCK